MSSTMKIKKKSSIKRRFFSRGERDLHLMLIPGLILTFIFAYLPMFGITMAFQRFNPVKGFFKSPFVGLANFEYVFKMPGFSNALWNTISISSMKILFSILVPLVLALLLNEVRRKGFIKYFQTTVFLPYFLSWVILGGIVSQVFALSGPINHIISGFGLDPKLFMLDNKLFPAILVSTDVWKGMGYNMVLFLAAIIGIDPGLYESADVDGAGKWSQCWYITIPSIMPTILIIVVLAMGSLLNAGFDQVFMLYNPIVYESGDIIDTFVYRLGIYDRQYSVAAAVGVFKSVVSLLMVGSTYYYAYRFKNYRLF